MENPGLLAQSGAWMSHPAFASERAVAARASAQIGNGDGCVDVADLGALASYYGAGTGGAAVPEPIALSLLLVGVPALLRRGSSR